MSVKSLQGRRNVEACIYQVHNCYMIVVRLNTNAMKYACRGTVCNMSTGKIKGQRAVFCR